MMAVPLGNFALARAVSAIGKSLDDGSLITNHSKHREKIPPRLFGLDGYPFQFEREREGGSRAREIDRKKKSCESVSSDSFMASL